MKNQKQTIVLNRNTPPLLEYNEFAKQQGLTPRTVASAIAKRSYPAVKIGKRLYINMLQLEILALEAQNFEVLKLQEFKELEPKIDVIINSSSNQFGS